MTIIFIDILHQHCITILTFIGSRLSLYSWKLVMLIVLSDGLSLVLPISTCFGIKSSCVSVKLLVYSLYKGSIFKNFRSMKSPSLETKLLSPVEFIVNEFLGAMIVFPISMWFPLILPSLNVKKFSPEMFWILI